MVRQLVNPESRHHFTSGCYGGTDTQIICVDEIKMNLLGG